MRDPKRFGAGIVGCGTIARSHASVFAAHPLVELVSLADVRLEAAEKLASQHGLGSTACYRDAMSMLAEHHLDIVGVCTWPGLHAPLTVAAAEAGAKAVICEKPFAPDLAQADRMLAACDAHGAKLIISHQHRFNPYVAEAHRRVTTGVIGSPELVHLRTGRGLMNNGSHMIDIARYVLGDIAWEWVVGQVQRDTDRYERGERIEELSTGIIGLAPDIRVLLETDLPGPSATEYRVYGSQGVIGFSTRHLRQMGGRGALDQPNGGWSEIGVPPGPGSHRAQLDELIAWLEGGPGHRGDAHNHRGGLEILMGIYESARRRALVRPPLPGSISPLEAMIESGELPVRVPGRVDLAI